MVAGTYSTSAPTDSTRCAARINKTAAALFNVCLRFATGFPATSATPATAAINLNRPESCVATRGAKSLPAEHAGSAPRHPGLQDLERQHDLAA